MDILYLLIVVFLKDKKHKNSFLHLMQYLLIQLFLYLVEKFFHID